MEDIETKVMQIIQAEIGVAASDIRPTARFSEDLKADDLNMVNLRLECEEVFEIQISDDDADKIHTVQNLIDVIRQLS